MSESPHDVSCVCPCHVEGVASAPYCQNGFCELCKKELYRELKGEAVTVANKPKDSCHLLPMMLSLVLITVIVSHAGYLAYLTSQQITGNVSLSFDNQVNILIAKGYPSAAGMSEEEFKNSLEPLRQDFREGSLIIIPKNMISLKDKLSRIELNGRQVDYWYNPDENITDHISTPDQPYLIHDMEDGQATKGLTPLNAEKKLQEQSRRPLTANEGFMLLTYQPQVLNEHNIWLTGSRYESSDEVPDVWLLGGKPKLDYFRASFSSSRWGSPSCGSRD